MSETNRESDVLDDPVIASSIFLTTATNVASMALLLGLAAVLVK